MGYYVSGYGRLQLDTDLSEEEIASAMATSLHEALLRDGYHPSPYPPFDNPADTLTVGDVLLHAFDDAELELETGTYSVHHFEKYHYDEHVRLYNAIAPWVSGFIDFTGEGDELWRVRFQNHGWSSYTGLIVYPMDPFEHPFQAVNDEPYCQFCALPPGNRRHSVAGLGPATATY